MIVLSGYKGQRFHVSETAPAPAPPEFPVGSIIQLGDDYYLVTQIDGRTIYQEIDYKNHGCAQ